MSGAGTDGDARLILASASPRRSEMLRNLGVAFDARPVDVDETPEDGEDPERYVLRLAAAKARAAARAEPAGAARANEVVLAADTIVVADGRLLGKPRDERDARGMLELLSARQHEVLTGVAVAAEGRQLQRAAERTWVRFARMSPEEIAWYVATGEPLDKAGAYAVQGLGALFVEAVSGNYSNVVGLPLPLAYRLLRAAGVSLLSPRT